jgi:hypothetical protein
LIDSNEKLEKACGAASPLIAPLACGLIVVIQFESVHVATSIEYVNKYDENLQIHTTLHLLFTGLSQR